MAEFQYIAIDRDGNKVSSSIEHVDEGSALQTLSGAGLYVLKVKRASPLKTLLKKSLFFKKISRKTLIEFSNNLSIMVRAGIPITEALRELTEAEKEHTFREILRAITSNIQLGASLSESLEPYKKLFPPIFLNLIKVGEETGRLDESMKEIAEHLKRVEELNAAIKRSMIYPIFAITATLGAMFFWLIYVLPKIMQVFKDLKITLPLTTRVLMVISDLSRQFWFILPAGLIALFVLTRILKTREETKLILDMLALRLPVIRLIVYNKFLALFSEQMRILIVAGITIDRTFDMLLEVMDNVLFKRAIRRIKTQVLSGGSIADGIQGEKIFPPLIGRMIRIGETTGNMDEQLKFLSDFYLQKLDDISQKLSKMIEPIVIGIIGIMFAFIIVGLIGPIYEIISTLGKM
jgi:type II secretory pathway component PulF